MFARLNRMTAVHLADSLLHVVDILEKFKIDSHSQKRFAHCILPTLHLHRGAIHNVNICFVGHVIC